MSIVNTETGEILGLADDMQAEYAAAHVNTKTGEVITAEDVRGSVARVKSHAESIWMEWAWQVENQVWTIEGVKAASWDEFRQREYANLSNVVAPRAERPELVARFRNAGLTQRETAETLGMGVNTVARHEPEDMRGSRGPSKTPQTVGFEDERPAPRPDRRATDNAEVTLVNDLRGPWHYGLIDAARAMTPEGRAHVIAALEATINRLKEI